MADATTTSPDAAPLPPRGGPAHHERGAILVEYALLIALIVVICIGAVQAFGAKVPAAAFSSVTSTI